MNCNYCERKCALGGSNTGYCGMYVLKNGQVTEKYPDHWSSYHATNIESIPFYHAFPNSRSMHLGSFSCNLNCHYCINAYVARGNPEDIYPVVMPAEKMVEKTVQSKSDTIIFGVNEVTVSLPSALRVAKAAKAEGIPVGCLTNAYMTEEATESMVEDMEFFNISLKSLKSPFYRKYAEIDGVEPILRNIKTIAKNRHVEITTPIVENVNDDEIMEIAAFIRDINPEIPWHVFRLLPEYKMENIENPDIEKINKRLKEAREILPNIYFANFIGSEWVSTRCPDCGYNVIERITLGSCGAKLIKYELENGNCPNCGKRISIYGGYVDRTTVEVGA
ncbi:MAG: radical SAM protein [Candidatus Alkaliphilus sp. MAG34]